MYMTLELKVIWNITQTNGTYNVHTNNIKIYHVPYQPNNFIC